MTYIESFWYHTNPDEPFCLLYEINENREWERKIELFRDGRVIKETQNESQAIEIIPIPSLHDINSDKQFFAFEISENTFMNIWHEEGSYFSGKEIQNNILYTLAGNTFPKAYALLRSHGFTLKKDNENIICIKGNIKLIAENTIELLGLYYLLQIGWMDKFAPDNVIDEYIKDIEI